MQSATPPSVAARPVRRASRAGTLRRRVVPIAALALVATSAFATYRWVTSRPPPPTQYRTAAALRHPITGKVVASGTLSALVTVQVGTQVSGRIQKLFVDFNSPVKKGQPVAKIYPQIYQASADQAEANYLAAEAGVAKAEADVRIADRQYARTKALHEQGLASQSDLDNALAQTESTHALLDAAKASLAQARATRNQAQVNLSYTNIISPIDGVVISRSVDVGQTVAASLAAPTLFTIAQDLTKMQVDTNVAEADVGRLKVGMQTSFTVDAFPGQRFPGKVREIRNAALTVQNVVTYDAVIDVDNADLQLRPGMTANVTVTYDQRDAALAVPNAALRFHPPGASPKEAPDTQTIWVLRGGDPRPVPVHPGLTDGVLTEVKDGDLHEGDEVVLEAIEPGSPSSSGGGSLRRLF
jgi:HlyD family secretion protein